MSLTTFDKLFYNLHTWYSITLCPNDQYQFYFKADRLIKVRANYLKVLTLGDYIPDCYMILEISEPRGKIQGSGPRLHYHGVIRFNNNDSLLQFMLYKIPRLLKLGIIDIDTIQDKKVWVKYMNKQHIIPQVFRELTNYADTSYFMNEYIPHDKTKKKNKKSK